MVTMIYDNKLPIFLRCYDAFLVVIDCFEEVKDGSPFKVLLLHFEPLRPLQIPEDSKCFSPVWDFISAFKRDLGLSDCSKCIISGRIPLVLLLPIVHEVLTALAWFDEDRKGWYREYHYKRIYVFDPKLRKALNLSFDVIEVPDHVVAKLLGGYVEEAKRRGIIQ